MLLLGWSLKSTLSSGCTPSSQIPANALPPLFQSLCCGSMPSSLYSSAVLSSSLSNILDLFVFDYWFLDLINLYTFLAPTVGFYTWKCAVQMLCKIIHCQWHSLVWTLHNLLSLSFKKASVKSQKYPISQLLVLIVDQASPTCSTGLGLVGTWMHSRKRTWM